MTLIKSGAKQTQLCRTCCSWTNHAVVCVEKTHWSEKLDDDQVISGSDDYHVLRCMGCDAVSVLHRHEFSEYDGYSEYRYPPASTRKRPHWFILFSFGRGVVARVMAQIYSAFDNESYRLCAIGIRALIEDIMIDKVGENGSLGKNIDAFITAGFVAEKSVAAFRAHIVETGNASMHRGHEPTKTDIETLLDVVEGLVADIYVYPAQIKNLSPTPPRVGK